MGPLVVGLWDGALGWSPSFNIEKSSSIFVFWFSSSRTIFNTSILCFQFDHIHICTRSIAFSDYSFFFFSFLLSPIVFTCKNVPVFFLLFLLFSQISIIEEWIQYRSRRRFDISDPMYRRMVRFIFDFLHADTGKIGRTLVRVSAGTGVSVYERN